VIRTTVATTLRRLRQPRYAAFAALMLVVALACIGAGTWQVQRFRQSVRENRALKDNAHAAAVPLGSVALPLVGAGPAPSREAIRFRTVTVTGSYAAQTEFLGGQSQGGSYGFDVVDPLQTTHGTLLVVRGFVPARNDGTPPPVPAPPAGPVTIAARLQTPSTSDDGAGRLPDAQLSSINPAQQQARLGRPVYNGYATLLPGTPGTSGLRALPKPNLSNPAGGAYVWQHFAYIIQWYVFALLALAAPFAISRSEAREAQRRFLGIDHRDDEFGLEAPRQERPQLTGAGGEHGAIAVRDSGALVRRTPAEQERIERATRLASRYGYELEVPDEPLAQQADGRYVPAYERNYDSSQAVHRSEGDQLHGEYNEYLWQLALADGNIPDISLPPAEPDEPTDS